MDDIESHRRQGRANERALRSPNLTDQNTEVVTASCLATVVNAELVNPSSSITINLDFLCPIAQLVPEDAVIFGGKLYERSSAEEFIRESLTKPLARSFRGSRCVKDPLNPSHIIYACENRLPVNDEDKLLEIIGSLICDVNDGWYTELQEKLERAQSAEPTTNRGNDGKLFDCCVRLLSIFTH